MRSSKFNSNIEILTPFKSNRPSSKEDFDKILKNFSMRIKSSTIKNPTNHSLRNNWLPKERKLTKNALKDKMIEENNNNFTYINSFGDCNLLNVKKICNDLLIENNYLKLKLSENIYKVRELENLLLEMSKAVGNPSMIGPHLINNLRCNSYSIIQLKNQILQLKNELHKKDVEIMKLKGENFEMSTHNYFHEGLENAHNAYNQIQNSININDNFKIKSDNNTPKQPSNLDYNLKNKIRMLESEIKLSEQFDSNIMKSSTKEDMNLLKIENLNLKLQLAKLKSGSEINSPLIYQGIPTNKNDSINTK